MALNSFSLRDPEVAEYMFRFISQDDVYADYCFALLKENLSIAEYCSLRFDDFRKFCEDNHGFTVRR